MKNLKLWLCLGLMCICLVSIKYVIKNGERFFENEEEEEKESGVEKQMAMWFQARAYPDPYYLNDKYEKGWLQAKEIRTVTANELSRTTGAAAWVSLGTVGTIGGRILSIAIDPSNGNNLFAGSASGGMWKSTNGGTSWQSVTTGFPVLGVSSIIINPTNSNIIYAGTGEVYRQDSTGTIPNPGNTGYSVWKTRGTYGVGILKSTNGGTSWTRVFTKNSADMFAVQTLRFDPADPNIVYAATTHGLYKTADAGVNWSKIFDVTYVSDVVINGSNLVASVGNLGNTVKGIFKSTNGGTSWTKITAGTPSTFQGYIKMDCVAAEPNTIIASIGVSETANVNEIYRSDDFGDTWLALGNSDHTQWQYWCAHDVAINPTNTSKIIFAGVNTYAGTISITVKGNGSTTISHSSSAIGSNIHDDVHDIKYDPSNSSVIYVCCDGGIYKSTNGGSTFTAINSGLAATQFYPSFGVSLTDAKLMVGGLQDNGVLKTTDGGATWTTMPGGYGDGAACVIDPSNDNNIIASGDARNFYLSTNRGSSASNTLAYLGGGSDSRTAFVTPVAMSKKKPSVVYVGSDNLHKSTNGGASWTNSGSTVPTNYIEQKNKTAIAMGVAPSDPNGDILYVSTSPFAQYDNDADALYVNGQPNILKSTNGGATLPLTSVKGTLPDRFVLDFAFDPTNDNIVFVTLGGFGTSHIYMTSDGGTNWTSIGSGSALPDVPFNAVLVDPVNPQTLYVGTDLGVYVSPDRGANWYDFNTGLSDATLVMDIQASADNQLILATHGKGIYKSPRFVTVLPLRFTSFDGKHENEQNKLTWNTADEINTKQYEIERSNDGLNFTRIGNVMAKNQSSSQAYQYTDILPAVAPVKLFYRIKCIDYNGAYTYTKVISLQGVINNTFAVLQNPFKEKISVSVGMDRQQPIALRLYDNKGRLVKQLIYAGARGINTIELNDVYYLPPGMYILDAVFGNERKTSKLIKQ